MPSGAIEEHDPVSVSELVSTDRKSQLTSSSTRLQFALALAKARLVADEQDKVELATDVRVGGLEV